MNRFIATRLEGTEVRRVLRYFDDFPVAYKEVKRDSVSMSEKMFNECDEGFNFIKQVTADNDIQLLDPSL